MAYKTNGKNLVKIINITKNRRGWEIDERNLKEAFGSLRYQNLEFWRDFTKDQFDDEIIKLKEFIKLIIKRYHH